MIAVQTELHDKTLVIKIDNDQNVNNINVSVIRKIYADLESSAEAIAHKGCSIFVTGLDSGELIYLDDDLDEDEVKKITGPHGVYYTDTHIHLDLYLVATKSEP